jgi:hypothetical protein
MATSSLLSVSRFLRANTVRGMGAKLNMQLPISGRGIIRFAPEAILSRWELVTPRGIARDEAHNVWHAGHVNDALVLNTVTVLLATESGGLTEAGLTVAARARCTLRSPTRAPPGRGCSVPSPRQARARAARAPRAGQVLLGAAPPRRSSAGPGIRAARLRRQRP